MTEETRTEIAREEIGDAFTGGSSVILYANTCPDDSLDGTYTVDWSDGSRNDHNDFGSACRDIAGGAADWAECARDGLKLSADMEPEERKSLGLVPGDAEFWPSVAAKYTRIADSMTKTAYLAEINVPFKLGDYGTEYRDRIVVEQANHNDDQVEIWSTWIESSEDEADYQRALKAAGHTDATWR